LQLENPAAGVFFAGKESLLIKLLWLEIRRFSPVGFKSAAVVFYNNGVHGFFPNFLRYVKITFLSARKN
jgi:hypothetical protein